MKRITISILFSAIILFVACGGRSASSSDSDVNPRDTVKVPEGYTGEDSIAYIENAVLKSNISAEDLLGLAEVHSVEDRLFNYNNEEKAEDNPEYAKAHIVTHRDSSALRLVNRIMRMNDQEEYEAWHDLNDARFNLWNDVSYRREWYSMKPLEIEGYYTNLSENRRAELDVERDIILNGKAYKQKGQTVTAKEWEKWIADNSVPEDLDMLEKNDTRIPSDSIVTDRVNTLKTMFARWLKARQDLAAALPKEQGDSYDYLTTAE